MKKKILSILITILALCTCMFTFTACGGNEPPAPKYYTITWQNYEGSILETDSEVKEGLMPTYDSATPTKESDAEFSYEFSGWSPEISAVTGDIIYVAQFNSIKNKYTITWKDHDGTVLELDENVEYGTIPTYNGTTPARERAEYTYTFIGWDKTVSEVTGNVVYTAQYSQEVSKFTVVWKNYDGTVLKTDTDLLYQAMPEYAGQTPTREKDAQYTYTFSGWSPSISKIVDDVVYIAQYSTTINKYTVTWKDYDGTVLELDESVEYGTTPSFDGENPTREKDAQYTYSFSGWNPTVDSVTGNVVYTAQYATTINKYTVTWKNYDGTVLETDTEVPYGTLPTYNGATPTREKAEYTYTFIGWDEILTEVTGNVVYTAQYSQKTSKFTVVWKNYDGTVLKTDTDLLYQETPEYVGQTPTRAKDAQYTYTFNGWSPTISQISDDIVYTAQYSTTLNKYTVTWKNYDGTVLETDTEVPYGEMPVYNGNTPTKNKDAQYTYAFIGWDKTVGSVVGDITYTARYSNTINKYTITWKNYDGTILKTDSVAYGSKPNYTGTTPTKQGDAQYGYMFNGWTPTVVNVSSNAEYIATFSSTINNYTVTWKNYDGTVLETDINVAYGSMPTYNGNTPTKPYDSLNKYTFEGWTPIVDWVNGDTLYTAVFSISESTTFTIKYDANGGTGAPSSQTKNKGQNITLSSTIPTNGEHVFIGWICAYDGNTYSRGGSFSLDANVTLYAVWGHGCDTCEESGQMPYQKTCDWCNGTKIANEQEWSRCNDCYGTGKVILLSKTCTSCKGFGGIYKYSCSSGHSWNTSTYPTQTCPTCGKTGSASRITTCGNCSGEGVIYYWYCNACNGNGGSYKTVSVECSHCSDGYNTAYKTCETCYGSKNVKNSAQSYTLTLKNGTTTFGSKTVYYGDPFKLNIPTKSGYTFVGWFDAQENGTQYTDRNGVSLKVWDEKNNKTLYAQWIKNYTISYNLDGGTVSNKTSYNIETATFTLNNPTKAGYKFIGWSGTDIDGVSSNVVISIGSTNNREYVANWEANTNTPYRIEYYLQNVNDNNYTLSGEYSYETVGKTDIKATENPKIIEHFTFNSSYADNVLSGNINGNGTLVLRLYYTRDTYTITTEANNEKAGTITNSGKYKYGKEITITATTNAGYTFLGWYNGETKVYANASYTFNVSETITLTAKWSTNVYSIEYELNGGVNSEDNVSTYTVETQTITLQNPIRACYTFNGWYLEEDFENQVTKIELGSFGDIKIYAKWTPVEYVITYNYGYSEKVTTDTYTIETPTFSLLTPTRDGYTFNGWYLEETFENQVLKITQGSCGDKVYYASWEANINTLVFNGNNNTSGTMSDVEICTSANINLPSNNFIKQGYTFKGWSTTADGEVEYLDCASYSMGAYSTYTLYAIWEANVDTKYTVEYYLQNIDNSYSLFKSEEFMGTTDEMVDAPQEELEHFTFNAEHDDNVISGIITGDGALVLKVYYQRNTYALSFVDLISNTTTKVGNFKYGEEVLLEPTNYLGYDFVGWYSGNKVLCEDLTYNVMIVEDLIVELKFEKKKEMDKYDFTSTETSCKIIKLTDTNLKEVVVPDYVTSIGDDAFYGCSSLESVTIGNGVESIGSRAFSGCSSLKEIVIPNSVTSIENFAFSSCKALSKINYTGTIDEWCTINFSDQWSNPSYYTKNLYINNELVENIVIQKATIVSAYAFFNNSALISVEMANNVSSIGKGAFRYCSSLTKVVLSDAITFVGDFAFDGCDKVLYNEKEGLKYIGSDDNQYLYLLGVVSKDIIIAHIDENCKFIGSWAFIRCESLESVNIPKDLMSIGDSAFYYCTSLTSILISKNVEYIGSDAFLGCKSIYCEAQEKLDDWNDRWAPITIPATPIYWYRETLPTTSGNYWHYDENGEIVIW